MEKCKITDSFNLQLVDQTRPGNFPGYANILNPLTTFKNKDTKLKNFSFVFSFLIFSHLKKNAHSSWWVDLTFKRTPTIDESVLKQHRSNGEDLGDPHKIQQWGLAWKQILPM